MRTWDGQEDSPPTPSEEALNRAVRALGHGRIDDYVVAAKGGGSLLVDHDRDMSLGARSRLVGRLAAQLMWEAEQAGVEPRETWSLIAKRAGDGPFVGVHEELLTEEELKRAQKLAESKDFSK